jgi:hypothetical protein
VLILGADATDGAVEPLAETIDRIVLSLIALAFRAFGWAIGNSTFTFAGSANSLQLIDTRTAGQVARRKVSGGTRSDVGRACRDGLIGLTNKLGVGFCDYLGARLNARGCQLVAPCPNWSSPKLALALIASGFGHIAPTSEAIEKATLLAIE